MKFNILKSRLIHFNKDVTSFSIFLKQLYIIIQLKLANAIGHQSPTFLGKAEILAEDKHFNLEHIFKMAIVLEVDINEFFEGIETTLYFYSMFFMQVYVGIWGSRPM